MLNKQKLINALEDLWDVIDHQEHDPMQANGVNRAIALVGSFPDDNPWIPVSERLPDEHTYQKVWITEKTPSGVNTVKGIWDYNELKHVNGMVMKYEAIAWKQYIPPEPYRSDD